MDKDKMYNVLDRAEDAFVNWLMRLDREERSIIVCIVGGIEMLMASRVFHVVITGIIVLMALYFINRDRR